MPEGAEVRTYYNDHNRRKLLADYVFGNPRFDAAIQGVLEAVPAAPASILDVGCGIGYSSSLLKDAFPGAMVVGMDLSDGSMAIARKLFGRSGLAFLVGDLASVPLRGTFDLLVMIDCYEHIPAEARAEVHLAIRHLLAPRGWLVLAMPTPEHQDFLRVNRPEGLQVIDEVISEREVLTLVNDAGLTLLAFQRVGVWNRYDYQHVVARNPGPLEPVSPPVIPQTALLRRAIRKFHVLVGRWRKARRLEHVMEKLGIDVSGERRA